jgi:sterol desaturase/sphingolipid hydroxylase (fatty acid hydroxylase superfamily)
MNFSSLYPEFTFVIGFLVLFCIENFYPNQPYKFESSWLIRLGLLLTLSIGLTQLVNSALSALIDNQVLFNNLSIYCAQQSPILNGLLVYLVYTFINYWWHRIRHSNDWLWRTFHQIHHSTHQLKSLTAFYAHPFDYLSTMVIINLLCSWILGLNSESASWATVISGFFEVWEHTNIKTPQWLGYIIVRPEMHRVHHEINQHKNNYSIPLWDMIFGTYENSKRNVGCGFENNLEKEITDMLLFIDVHQSHNKNTQDLK